VAEGGNPRWYGNTVFVWHCDHFIKAIPDYKVIGRRAGSGGEVTGVNLLKTGSRNRKLAQESAVPELPL
jgi:hypothetical protein